jgi:hypothetical protein
MNINVKSTNKILVRKPEEKIYGRPTCRQENIKMDLIGMGWEDANRIHGHIMNME